GRLPRTFGEGWRDRPSARRRARRAARGRRADAHRRGEPALRALGFVRSHRPERPVERIAASALRVAPPLRRPRRGPGTGRTRPVKTAQLEERTGVSCGRHAFAATLSELAKAPEAARVSEKTIGRLAVPVNASGKDTVGTASIGMATFPADGDNAERLLGAA